MEKPLKILLVEDEFIIALNIKTGLKRRGYDVFSTIAKGEDALKVVKENPPELILMDIRLAGHLDGIETYEQILSFHTVPIIFMTGYSDQTLRERAMKLHPLAYFLKPLQLDQITSTIRDFVESKQK